MTIHAGILCFKTLVQFPCRLLPLTWRKCAVTCLQNRDYSSSAPVRYIPKNSSKVKKLESSPQTKGSEVKEFREFAEVKQSGRRVRKSLDFNEKPQNQNQNRYSNSSFSDAQKAAPDLKDQTNHLSGAVGYELMEEPEEVFEELKGSKEKEFPEFLDASALKREVKHWGRGVHKNRVLNEKPQDQNQQSSQKENRNQIQYSNSLFNDVQKESPGLEDRNDRILGAIGYELIEEPEEVFEELNILEEKKCPEQGVVQGIKHDAEQVAIKLLATRAFTAVELRKKLCGKNFPLGTVEAVIDDFISRGLINDSLYAEAFSRSRWSSLSWGPRRIKQALFNKGVSNVDAEKAIKLVFEEGKPDEDEELIHGLSKLSMDNLVVQASKQWLRGQEVPKETRKSRIVRWLQYRGFSWGVISFILKKLESE
ncbi:hypothetical protein C1H46_008995 [Malus baccata]|uniref:Regulatory protein RecX n=1 Tax=Malus baccata TaxID=106549 RepID=A0A540N2Y7_MALBA|nr:hypothetical protein C1H46_008995 [Malus baccata]